MATLHTVNISPYAGSALASCLRFAMPGSGILLIEDAVVAAVAGSTWSQALAEAMRDYRLYVLRPDLEARGLSEKLMSGITVVDDAGFVALTVEHDKVVAWS